jgi:hypothetical protein
MYFFYKYINAFLSTQSKYIRKFTFTEQLKLFYHIGVMYTRAIPAEYSAGIVTVLLSSAFSAAFWLLIRRCPRFPSERPYG